MYPEPCPTTRLANHFTSSPSHVDHYPELSDYFGITEHNTYCALCDHSNQN